MEKVSPILLNPVKNFVEQKSESENLFEQIIEDSKENHFINQLLNKAIFDPSDKIIEQILQKCDIYLSH
jgi:hypothetical protein